MSFGIGSAGGGYSPNFEKTQSHKNDGPLSKQNARDRGGKGGGSKVKIPQLKEELNVLNQVVLTGLQEEWKPLQEADKDGRNRNPQDPQARDKDKDKQKKDEEEPPKRVDVFLA